MRPSGAPGEPPAADEHGRDVPRAQPRRVARRSADPLLPERSADDSPEGWHEADDSNDDRLRRDVPPHWG